MYHFLVADSTDFAKKTVEVEPALPPVNDPTKDSLDNVEHPASLRSDERMDLYNLQYDKLVCAVGCYSASFGIPGVGQRGSWGRDHAGAGWDSH